MKGLDLCQDFFESQKDILFSKLPEISDYAAFGLFGQGSECLGLDDEISQDHDFGPRFFIIFDTKYAQSHPELVEAARQIYSGIPKSYKGFNYSDSHMSFMRHGVYTIKDLLLFYTGRSHVPSCSREWFETDDYSLLCLTNGRVFYDKSGVLEEFRKKLEGYYPQQVQQKKISALLAQIAKSGQYNLARQLKRKDYVSAHLELSSFLQAYYSVLYILIKKYKPYPKFLHSYLAKLNAYPVDLLQDLESLAVYNLQTQGSEIQAIVESLCSYLRYCVALEYPLSSQDSFLQLAAQELHEKLHDPYLRSLHLLRGGA